MDPEHINPITSSVAASTQTEYQMTDHISYIAPFRLSNSQTVVTSQP